MADKGNKGTGPDFVNLGEGQTGPLVKPIEMTAANTVIMQGDPPAVGEPAPKQQEPDKNMEKNEIGVTLDLSEEMYAALIESLNRIDERITDLETFVDRIVDGGMSSISNFDLGKWREKRVVK